MESVAELVEMRSSLAALNQAAMMSAAEELERSEA